MILEGMILQKESADASRASGIDTEKEARIIAQCSDATPDYHNHVMDPVLLGKFAKSLEDEELPFLSDHSFSTKNLMGRSVNGYTEGEGDTMKVFGEWSIPKTSSKEIIKDFLEGVDNGLYNAVSVGLNVIEARCNICSKHAFISRKAKKWSDICLDHYPGREYKKKKALWVLKDGRLLEVSNVVKGANPNAKYKEEALAMSEQIKSLDSLFKGADFDAVLPFVDDIHTIVKSQLQASNRTTGFSFPTDPSRKTEFIEGDEKMELEEIQQELSKMQWQAGLLVKELPDDPIKALQKVISELDQSLKDKVEAEANAAKYKEKSDKYDKLLANVVAKALKSGVEAEGDDFDKDKWEKMLTSYGDFDEGIGMIAAKRAEWDKKKEKTLPEGEGPQIEGGSQEGTHKSETFDDADAFL